MIDPKCSLDVDLALAGPLLLILLCVPGESRDDPEYRGSGHNRTHDPAFLTIAAWKLLHGLVPA